MSNTIDPDALGGIHWSISFPELDALIQAAKKEMGL